MLTTLAVLSSVIAGGFAYASVRLIYPAEKDVQVVGAVVSLLTSALLWTAAIYL